MSTEGKTPLHRLAVATVLTGTAAGVGGMSLALLLHVVQHLAYGYSLDAVISAESFLQGVSHASPLRRILVLTGCGALAGGGWWALYRYGRPLVSIRQAVQSPGQPMPLPETSVHALLQVVTVALGSPLGREVAPREIGAALGGWLSRRAGLTAEEGRILIACGAGAGLAAVYNVPLAGAFFVLEVLLGTFSLPAVLPALITSAIAARIAWIGLGDAVQYPVMPFATTGSLLVWSMLTGPVFGVAAYGFSRLATAMTAKSPRDWRLVPSALAVFAGIGVLAIGFPQLLGNGKGPIQLSLADDLSVVLALALLLLRVLVTLAALRVGAKGGMLTPGMTIGALLATVVGGLWTTIWPGEPLGAFALVGAGAFLASSMKMPLTAIALILEFTHVPQDVLFPVIFAVCGSCAADRLCDGWFSRVRPIEDGRTARITLQPILPVKGDG
ncbi:MAG: chloride channel protein [Rhodospirillales bacterium]|nr:chloride channel protein [Rhodospirillales bacterium]